VRNRNFYILLITGSLCLFDSHAQGGFNQISLKVLKRISLKDIGKENLQMDVNPVDTILYLASPETNSIFSINPLTGKQLSVIHNIPEPKRISYIRKQDELFVSTATTKCFFYNGKSLNRTHKVQVMSPSDAVLYDSTNDQIYVGYQDGVKRISPIRHKLTGFIPLYQEPKSIVYDAGKNRLYVNNSNAYSTSVIDLDAFRVAIEWETDEPLINDMALDTAGERLFLASKEKAEIISINTKTGRRTIFSVPTSINRMHIDSKSRLLYLISENAILIYHVGFSKFIQVLSTKIEGRMVSSFLSPELRLLVIAREPPSKVKIELIVYQIEKN